MNHFESIGCVIMASGLGQRFGSNKLLTDFHGRPLYQYALEVTSMLKNRVVVTRHAPIAEYARSQNIPSILHQEPNRNDTVRLGLSALLDTRGCFFLPSDQPLLSRETFLDLLGHAQAQPDQIWRPACGDRDGSPMYFPSFLYEELLHLPEKKGGGYVMKQHPELLRRVAVTHEYELMDADTPEDLEQLARIFLKS